jgi:hypothetical protein
LLPVGDLVTEELSQFFRHQITNQQRIGYNTPQAVLHSPSVPEDGQNCCLKHVKLIWIYQ